MIPSEPLPELLPSLLLVSSLGEIFLWVAVVVLLLISSGLISGSEVAFFSLTPNDYEELQANPTRANVTLLDLKDRPRLLLATILIANNFINIAIVLVSELLLSQLFPEALFLDWAAAAQEKIGFLSNFSSEALASGLSFTITVIGVTFLLVLFGEVAPKVYARYNKIKLAQRMAGPMVTMQRLFYPFAIALVRGASVVERRLEGSTYDAVSASQEDIDEAIDLTVSQEEDGEEGTRQDVDILKRIVQFNNVTVRQVMRSRGDVIAVDRKIGYHELLEVVKSSGYSRIPVFEDDFDKVRGVLYVKDLLGNRAQPDSFDWNTLVREEVLFVPENKKISDLLSEFQHQKTHMAVVVDEYGGTEGIVTLEDVLEEVIGDIHDEFDEGDDIIYERIDNLNYLFDGKTLLNDACRLLDIPTSTFDAVKGEAESLAGLILEILKEFPEVDQEVIHEGFRFRVTAMTRRRVEQVLITLPEPPDND